MSTYSGGMRRRLDLAAGLVAQPEVMFRDEPTTGLDPRSRQAMWQVVGELVAAGVSVFLTTQYLERVRPDPDHAGVAARARHEPITPVTETLRGLLLGGPVGGHAVVALLWCGGILAASVAASAVLFARRS